MSHKHSINLVLAAGLAWVSPALAVDPITQDLGGGWSVTIFNPAAVSVTPLGLFEGRLVLTKVATVFGTTDEGIPTPIVLQFSQNAPSQLTAPQIGIAFENITNQSGVNWTSYTQALLQSSRVSFNQPASAGFAIAPYTTTTYNAGVGATEVTYAGGVVLNGETWNGGGGNPTVIDINLGVTPTIFTLKEIPLPTPGSAMIFGIAGLVAARRKR